MNPLLNIAISAAERAGKIIAKGLDDLDRVKVEKKGDNDFVTDVDQRAEQDIIYTIRKAYPDASILAEESGLEKKDDVLWIIDPLDGTANFLHGFPHFAVSIAIQVKGITEHAVVYDPLRHEMFTASRGKGAHLNKSLRLRVSKQVGLSGSLIGTGFPFKYPELHDDYLKTFKAIMSQETGIRRVGAAALDLAYLAAGRLDGFWEFKLKPWDIAAGALIVKEAGGLIGDFDGTEKYMENGHVVAGTPKVFKPLLQLIHSELKGTA